jgi:hypothetical protein
MTLTWAQLREVPWGTMLVFPGDWDIYPYCIVPAGTRAVVTDNHLADAKDGCIYLLTDNAEVTRELKEWSGCVQFNPMNDGHSWDDESPVALE